MTILHLKSIYYLPSWQGGDRVVPRCFRTRFGYSGSDFGGYELTEDRKAVTCLVCLSVPEVPVIESGGRIDVPSACRRGGKGPPAVKSRPMKKPVLTASLSYPYLAPKPPRRPLPSMEQVSRQVAQWHGVSLDDMYSDSRTQRLVEVRWEAWSILYEQRREDGRRRWSLPQIGRAFNRDHSTILHGIREHERRMAERMAAE